MCSSDLPPVRELLIDWRTALFLARIGGRLISDNRLLEAIVREIESRGFTVIGPADVEPTLLARVGPYGRIAPTEAERHAIASGLRAARNLGRRDVGQAVVMLGDAILDTEGADGTDAMIARCAGKHKDGAGPILVKARKPQQQMRADPPVVGMVTLQTATASGFRGVAVESGGVLLLNGPALARAADAAGIFLAGVDEKP